MIWTKKHLRLFFLLLIVFVFSMASCSLWEGEAKKDNKVEKLPEGKTVQVEKMKTYQGVTSQKPETPPEQKTTLSAPPESVSSVPSKQETKPKTVIPVPEIKSVPSTIQPPPSTEKAVPALKETPAAPSAGDALSKEKTEVKPIVQETKIKDIPSASTLPPPVEEKAVPTLEEASPAVPAPTPVAAPPVKEEAEAKIITVPMPERFSSPALQMRLKKRVGILDVENDSGYSQEKIGEEVVRKLDNRLSATRQVIVLDKNTIRESLTHAGFKFSKLSDPAVMKHAYRSLGIQAFVLGTVTEVKLLSSKISETSPEEISSATVTTEIRLFDASTGNLLKTFTGKSLLSGVKQTGAYSRETAVIKAIDLSLDDILGGLLQQIENLDWTTTIARVEGDRLYLNTGKLSGLRVGDTLEVFEPGKEIFHPITNLSMGWTTGRQKGTVRIDELFGVDASIGKTVQGSGFNPMDVLKPAVK